MRKFLLASFLGAAFCIGSIEAADIVVKVRPPALKIEHHPPRPGPDYVWVGGAWVWNGAWVWAPGHYVHAPYAGAVWIGGSWVGHGGGWAWVGGHWGRR